jgi:hypothetical protein
MDTLSTCEKKYLEIFRRRMTEKIPNSDYNSLSRMLLTKAYPKHKPIKKRIKSDVSVHSTGKNIEVRGDKVGRNNFSSFTDGLFEFKNDDEFIRPYKEIKAGDKLFIWQTLGMKGPDHIVGHIVTASGKNFSFGYGYLGHEITDSSLQKYIGAPVRQMLYMMDIKEVDTSLRQGVIYSPDYLFEHRIRQQLTKGKGRYLKLISSSVLTDEDIAIFGSKLDMILTPTENMLSVNLISPDQNQYYLSYYIKFQDVVYCAYSILHNKAYTNCAGFLETMFSNIISCPGVLAKYRPAPEHCRQISVPSPCD